MLGASHSGTAAGHGDLISVDIGGTSCDIALIKGGRPLVTGEAKLDRYPLRQQMVDVTCIGAGGGSIGWIDEGGALRVGPRSAGAFPGPACYGRGGTEPTVTDASLVLGYISARNFGFGEVGLDVSLAERALDGVARRIGLEVPELALGMHRILNSMMADAIRLASVNRGHDPRKFSLIGLGGAGPVHAAALMGDLGCRQAIIPPLPGVLCANGLLAASVEHEHTITYIRRLGELDLADFERAMHEPYRICCERMQAEAIDPDSAELTRIVEARYTGQSYDLDVEIPAGLDTTEALVEHIRNAFAAEHERIYGYAQPGKEIAIVALPTLLSKPVSPPILAVEEDREFSDAPSTIRPALFSIERGYEDIPVYERNRLRPETVIAGPAILEQPDTTTVIYPGQRAEVSALGHLIIRRQADEA